MPFCYRKSGERIRLRNPGDRLRKPAFSQLTYMFAMSIKPALLIVMGGIALTACRPDPSQTERGFLRDWSAPGISPSERAALVNRFFTNGTPIATVVRLLGPGYIRVTPYSMVSVDGHPIMCYLAYTNQRVTVRTSARVDSGVDLLAATFTGAGYELDVWASTNIPGLGQPEGGANGKQPVGSDTNRTSAAAPSRRSP